MGFPNPLCGDMRMMPGLSKHPAFEKVDLVDGKIVDLNRIQLPAETPIIDERFKDEPNKPANRSGG